MFFGILLRPGENASMTLVRPLETSINATRRGPCSILDFPKNDVYFLEHNGHGRYTNPRMAGSVAGVPTWGVTA